MLLFSVVLTHCLDWVITKKGGLLCLNLQGRMYRSLQPCLSRASSFLDMTDVRICEHTEKGLRGGEILYLTTLSTPPHIHVC